MKEPLLEAALINRSIWECLYSTSLRIFIDKGALNTGAISISEHTVAFFSTVLPAALVHGTVAPLASACTCHSSHVPLALILPSLLLTDEHSLARLVPVQVGAIVEVGISELTYAMAIGNVVLEVAVVEFALRETILSEALHFTMDPVTFVSLLEG